MYRITVDTPIAEAVGHRDLAPFRSYLKYAPFESSGTPKLGDLNTGTIREHAALGWSAEGVAAGLDFLLNRAQKGKADIHFIYEDAEEDSLKKDVNLIRLLPDGEKKDRPSVILCAGGGYGSVCTLVESLPTARHFSQQGCVVWLLTYRVGFTGCALSALDDVAAAVAWLGSHRDLGFDPDNDAIGGVSAAGNLVCSWGTGNNGWKRYGLPKPKAMFPVYAYVDLEQETHRDGKGGLCVLMFGPDYRSYFDVWDIIRHVDVDYPPCYFVCGKNDTVVDPGNSERMKELLDRCGVPVVLEEGENAPHAFGDGTGFDVEGWPERALAFMESL